MVHTYQNYIFDLGNVLFSYDPLQLTSRHVNDRETQQLICDVVFNGIHWSMLDAGTLTDEEARAAFCELLPQEHHAAALEVFDHWIENLPPVDGMNELLDDIKAAGGKLFLLSNISKGFAERYTTFPHILSTLSRFDGLMFSGAVCKTKPHRDIYEHLLATYSLSAADCVFIDDRADNVEAARAVGMGGIVFDGDVSALRQKLF